MLYYNIIITIIILNLYNFEAKTFAMMTVTWMLVQ